MIDTAALESQSRKMALDALEYITANAETGFCEKKTSAYMEKAFRALGFEPKLAGNIPGFVCDMEFGEPGPKLAIMAELDALNMPEHPLSDPVTGAAHACGHNAQCAALLGAANMLKEMGEGLCGSIRFVVVPAEELIELDYRKSLIEKGVIRYPSGKVEFLSRGLFDGVDAAILTHTFTSKDKCAILIKGCNGCILKSPEFHGVASHAGGSPELGVNALYAANVALDAVNALRETFRDDDHIRFHGIITRGGTSANIIPERVSLEAYVRGANLDAMFAANARIDRALASGASALGARLTMDDTMGYMPLVNDSVIASAVKATEKDLGIPVIMANGIWDTGCTDMGDLSQLMPTMQMVISGAVGNAHTTAHRIEDKETAVVKSALMQALTARELLSNGAAKLKEAIAAFKPGFASKEEYFRALERHTARYEAVEYSSDGSVTLTLGRKDK